MLVLTRRAGEEIVIGGDVRVTVVAVSGGRVRLGVTAPRSVPVLRMELVTENLADAGTQNPRESRGT
jgi:carbon storage regulator